ncbi:MAG: hypothetical protein KDC11_08960 [Chitinophagaceae bacterium]|nr:hypothetical protein [Chitinophagaceae bacterium]
MKYSFLTVLLATFLFSCGNEQATEESNNEAVEETTMTEEQPMAEATGPMDPVCDMVKGDDWTEYSVNGTDTVWFCSTHCKEAYDANPEKYAKK